MKTALICGISGQDGAWLSELLLSKGYSVFGTSRDAQMSSFRNLERLKIRDRVCLLSMTLTDFRSVLQVLKKVQPDEIYNLAGQSSVGLSFEQPVESLESNALGTLNMLESIRFLDRPTRLYQACSSECFGNTGSKRADEQTPFRPRSPYAVAKATAYWEVANYREAYDIFACSGLLFNHESPLRPERFVTQKIVSAACRIYAGSREKLTLGNLNVERDWGWAPEYVDAMWRMLQLEKPEDFVIATGESHKLENFVETAFKKLEMDWRQHVEVDSKYFRVTDIAISRANPEKAESVLGWQAENKMADVAGMMIEAELNRDQVSQ